MDRLKDKLIISSDVLETASYIYRKALKKKLLRDRSIFTMITASLYATCRNTKTSRILKDVAESANVRRKDITRCYKLLHHELELKILIVDPIQCIARISSKLKMAEKTKRYDPKY